jgi:predicted nucleic acid-binding protein
VIDRHESGVVDTSHYIDLALLDPAVLPVTPELTAITMAELHQGVAMVTDAVSRAARTEKLGAAIASAHGLPLYTRNPADLVGLEDMLRIIEV